MKPETATLLRAFAAALVTVSLGACALPKKSFDAYDPAEAIDPSPDFENLDLEREISPEMLSPSAGPYRVGPGDRLAIEIAEVPNTAAQTTVMPDGMLYFDTSGGLNVKGKTLPEISTLLASDLKAEYPTPVVTVNLAEAQSQRFWVLGQVKKPGAYPISTPTPLVEAISKAGGLYSGQNPQGDTQETVDLDRAFLIRSGELVPVDFRSLIEHGDMSQNVYVRAGDYIYLPSIQHRAVYVLGAVRNPGPIYYDTDPTVLSSVALAGGPRQDAVVTKAIVIRGSMTKPRVAVVNIHNIMRGYDPDARLIAGDIVWVPDTAWTYLKNYAQGVLVTAAQAVAVQEGLAVLGKGNGGAGVTINAGGY
ncbi:MAG: SLBB domain-containing protein [Verrucomicrobiae bacterium]|nr:SLBB domain-containing protein [Verrucomicrobiae bacterium]MCP5541110.1 SLBB domain-containing protein [Akkermansiaceae bacterium]